jgi:hypothetical protein
MSEIRAMRFLTRFLTAGLLPLCLAGCVKAELVMNRDGPIVPKSAAADAQTSQFKELWRTAQTAAMIGSANDANDPSGRSDVPVTPTEVAANRRLLIAGMALVYNGCNDFFIKEGERQEAYAFSKDLTGALVPNLSGALGLVPSAGVAVPIVGFVGGGITSGISVAASDFLFGSDNIDDVRTMTMSALAAHESTVMALFANSVDASNKASTDQAQTATGNLGNTSRITANFWWVTNQISDHQAICQPGKILALAKQSIAKSNICTSTSASSTNGTGASNAPSGALAPPAAAKPAATAKQSAGATPKPPAAAPASPLPARVTVEVKPSCDPPPGNTNASNG